MMNILIKHTTRTRNRNYPSLLDLMRLPAGKSLAIVTVLVLSLTVLVKAQRTEQTRQISVVQDMATVARIPAPQLEFVGKEAYDLNGAKGTRYKLTVTNRASHPDFLWWPSSQLPACGTNENASRTWVEIFSSPGDKRLAGFCALRSSEDLAYLWFPVASGEKGPPCVYLVMTDRQTGKKYNSNRVCSRSFTISTGSLKGTSNPDSTTAKGHEGSKGWIEISSVQLNKDRPDTRLGKADGTQPSGKEREAGTKEIQAEQEKEKPGGFGNDRIGTVGYGNNLNQRPRVPQPDLMIKQFLFPPTNDKALRVNVVNQGAGASGACRLILTVRKINGTAVGRQTHVNVPALAPGANVWLVIDAKGILPNNVSLQSTTFKLNVDGTGLIAESDETNNEVWHNL